MAIFAGLATLPEKTKLRMAIFYKQRIVVPFASYDCSAGSPCKLANISCSGTNLSPSANNNY